LKCSWLAWTDQFPPSPTLRTPSVSPPRTRY
jgi:hypothetical protein